MEVKVPVNRLQQQDGHLLLFDCVKKRKLSYLQNPQCGTLQQQVYVILQKLCLGAVFFLPFTLPPTLHAAELRDEAASYVSAWLKANPKRLGFATPRSVRTVVTTRFEITVTNQETYAVVNLDPSGFVVLIPTATGNPIAAFSPTGEFHNDTNTPLQKILSRQSTFLVSRAAAEPNVVSPRIFYDPNALSGYAFSISDERIKPLLETKWGQQTIIDENGETKPCYNYYTPPYGEGNASNYPCGCNATAMAQIMKYHEYPAYPRNPSPMLPCFVGLIPTIFYLRGGDGSQGPYDWQNMPLDPDYTMTDVQRRAIGALTYDASVGVYSLFSSGFTGALLQDVANSFKSLFFYRNAVVAQSFTGTIDAADLIKMINPNLDAGAPVMLGIRLGAYGNNHTVVCDGYGYDAGTMYHHLNMGWEGLDDVWYALPEFTAPETGYDFDTVHGCVYNILPIYSGVELVSGRVIDQYGQPVEGATITATRTGGGTATGTTLATGHWFGFMLPNSTYTASVSKPGYEFTSIRIFQTGESVNLGACGNVWGLDFTGTRRMRVSGRVYRTDNGMGLDNALVQFSHDGACAVTSNGGFYQRYVPAGWTGTITVIYNGWEFSPPNRIYSSPLFSDLGQQDFAAEPIPAAAPFLINPPNGVWVDQTTPTLQSSSVVFPSGSDHARSQWQVSLNPVFTDLAWDSGTNYPAGTTLTVPSGALAYNTTYYWRTRQCDDLDYWSPWSASWNFKTIESGDYNFIRHTNNFIIITGYSGHGGSITIPSTLGGCPVTSIGEEAFSDCTSLTSVTIPDSFNHIGVGAFRSCSNLSGIVLPNGLKYIDADTFRDCSRLLSINIPNGVTSIVQNAFYNCTNLASVTIPNSVALLGIQAFGKCANIKNLTLCALPVIGGQPSLSMRSAFECLSDPSNHCSVVIRDVTNIRSNAFILCEGLTEVTIPESVTEIGMLAFFECDGLTGVTIPDSVTAIEECAFANCESLTEVTLGRGIESVGLNAFGSCLALSKITLLSMLSDTAGWLSMSSVFGSKAGRCEVVIGGDITRISDHAFAGWSNLSSVSISSRVLSIGPRAFFDCRYLTCVIIPDSVTAIEEYAFANCESLTEVTLGRGIESIGLNAFGSCLALSKITLLSMLSDTAGWLSMSSVFGSKAGGCEVVIGGDITRISDRAFAGWSNLSSVSIPPSVSCIGSNAFENCRYMTNVTIPDIVTNIGQFAFANCERLTEVTLGRGIRSIGFLAFANCAVLSKITLLSMLSDTAGWQGMGSIFGAKAGGCEVVIGDDVTRISDRAFLSWSSLSSVSIPSSVLNIGTQAFSGCRYLTSVTIPDSVTNIDQFAFQRCSSLNRFALGMSVSNIGNTAFRECTALPSINIPDSVVRIGTNTFGRCSSLTNIQVSSQNPNYSSTNGVLFSKDSAELVQCPAGITGSYLIPYTVTTIRDYAFDGCSGLTYVYFIGNAPDLGGTNVFLNSPATVCYLAGTTGWGATLAGRPTAAWPAITKPIQSDAGFSFNIMVPERYQIRVDACTDLTLEDWNPVANKTAPAGAPLVFTDTDSSSHPQRFYRITFPQ